MRDWQQRSPLMSKWNTDYKSVWYLRKGDHEIMRIYVDFDDCLCPGENGPVNWGHCGISLGDGRIIHAWDTVRIDDYREIEAMTALSGDHPGYIGWVPIESVLYGNEISIQEIGQ